MSLQVNDRIVQKNWPKYTGTVKTTSRAGKIGVAWDNLPHGIVIVDTSSLAIYYRPPAETPQRFKVGDRVCLSFDYAQHGTITATDGDDAWVRMNGDGTRRSLPFSALVPLPAKPRTVPPGVGHDYEAVELTPEVQALVREAGLWP